jgi:DNA-binding GntR family transcriptional regulator
MARSGSNRSDTAYESLRSDIVGGRWLPDTILSTYGLTEELGMSRTPIIGALKRLEADGLIEIIPQVGCRVLQREHEEISETFVIRAALEALGAERAAVRITDRELASLEQVLEAAEAAAAAGDAESYEQANQAFHAQILAASRLTHMPRILSGLWTLNRYQLATSRFLGQRMTVSNSEHREILEALKARDAIAARETVQNHLRRCSEDYLAFVQPHADRGGPQDRELAGQEAASGG